MRTKLFCGTKLSYSGSTTTMSKHHKLHKGKNFTKVLKQVHKIIGPESKNDRNDIKKKEQKEIIDKALCKRCLSSVKRCINVT